LDWASRLWLTSRRRPRGCGLGWWLENCRRDRERGEDRDEGDPDHRIVLAVAQEDDGRPESRSVLLGSNEVPDNVGELDRTLVDRVSDIDPRRIPVADELGPNCQDGRGEPRVEQRGADENEQGDQQAGRASQRLGDQTGAGREDADETGLQDLCSPEPPPSAKALGSSSRTYVRCASLSPQYHYWWHWLTARQTPPDREDEHRLAPFRQVLFGNAIPHEVILFSGT
jgi:hypothetical protein